MEETKELHVYSNGTDTVVATSVKDAIVVWSEYIGDDYLDGYGDESDWEMQKYNDELTILQDDPPESTRSNIPKQASIEQRQEWLWAITAKNNAWAACCGRGFLCSTEW